jgi:hypothetical protein
MLSRTKADQMMMDDMTRPVLLIKFNVVQFCSGRGIDY